MRSSVREGEPALSDHDVERVSAARLSVAVSALDPESDPPLSEAEIVELTFERVPDTDSVGNVGLNLDFVEEASYESEFTVSDEDIVMRGDADFSAVAVGIIDMLDVADGEVEAEPGERVVETSSDAVDETVGDPPDSVMLGDPVRHDSVASLDDVIDGLDKLSDDEGDVRTEIDFVGIVVFDVVPETVCDEERNVAVLSRDRLVVTVADAVELHELVIVMDAKDTLMPLTVTLADVEADRDSDDVGTLRVRESSFVRREAERVSTSDRVAVRGIDRVAVKIGLFVSDAEMVWVTVRGVPVTSRDMEAEIEPVSV